MSSKKRKETSDLENDRELMDRFSRQIGAFGTTMMSRLVQMDVLIVNVGGCGVEIAKNLILLGPKRVTLCDSRKVEIIDLGANFCLEKDDVGKRSRATASVRELSELNASCDVGVLRDEDGKEAECLTEELLESYDVLVMCNASKKELMKWNKFCRNHKKKVPERCGGFATESDPIGFVSVHTRGASGSVFTDFGDNFEIFDGRGEPAVERLIANITCEKEGIVEVLEAQPRQHLSNITEDPIEGWVQLQDVEGCYAKDMESFRELGYQSINEAPIWRIQNMKREIFRNGKRQKVFDPFHYKIGDTSKLSKYQRGGILKQVRVPKRVNFKSFEEALRNPGEHIWTDMTKYDWACGEGVWHQLHIAFVSVLLFEEKNGRLPKANDDKDTAEVVKIAKSYNDAMCVVKETIGEGAGWCVQKLNEDLISNYARLASVELQPMCTFLGGIVAQEVSKWTGKFTPNQGFLHLDFMEILPDERPKDVEPLNSRYDHQIAAFGKSFQEKLGDIRTFMVGCGALGCELLKNFAMMGVACHDGKGKGLITVTDDDKIEVSNLNRQFLFRPENVQQHKADAATSRIVQYNPDIKVDTKKVKVMPATENVFDDKFWDSQDFITNALDNIKARLYVDSKCVEHAKPLLESGTLGTKCNTVIVVPYKTKSYGDGTDAKEGGNEAEIPMCTLRNFPTLLDHCVEWSRAQFTDLFVEPMKRTKMFSDNPDAYLKKLESHIGDDPLLRSQRAKDLEAMRSVRDIVQLREDLNFEKCVEYAWNLYHEHFRDRIKTLMRDCPPDMKTEDGQPFWNAKKRIPDALSADFKNESFGLYALEFITSVANLMAAGLGLVKCPQGASGLLPWDHKFRDSKYITSICAKLKVPKVQYRKTENIHEEEKEDDGDEKKMEIEEEDDDDVEFEELLAWLKKHKSSLSGVTITPADFEKDQDANFHIDFIESYSNLRATNYHIKHGSRHKTKMIAGKILPAILTATASITGLIMLELYKIVQKKPLDSIRNAFCNLGVNVYTFENPDPIPVTKEYTAYEGAEVQKAWPEKGFTKWDKIVVQNGDMTVQEFVDYIKKLTNGLNVTTLQHPLAEQKGAKGHGSFLWMARHFSKKKQKVMDARREMKISELIHEIHDVDQSTKQVNNLVMSVENDDMDEFILPRLVYRWG